MKRILVLPALVLSGSLALLACSDSGSDLPRLEFHEDMPGSILVGDTTELLVVTKVSTTLQGRETTDDSYEDFTLESSDSSVVKVAFDRRLVGVKAGSATVNAFDNVSDARTGAGRTITVINP